MKNDARPALRAECESMYSSSFSSKGVVVVSNSAVVELGSSFEVVIGEIEDETEGVELDEVKVEMLEFVEVNVGVGGVVLVSDSVVVELEVVFIEICILTLFLQKQTTELKIRLIALTYYPTRYQFVNRKILLNVRFEL